MEQPDTNLLVEDFVVFVDISDISFVLVKSLAREFPSLINTVKATVKIIRQVATIKRSAHSLFNLLTTRSIASSLGLLSPYWRVLASRYRSSDASLWATEDDEEAETITAISLGEETLARAPGTRPSAASFCLV
jgi:hypothetical protein